ncbi:MAG: hydrogenase formation protein HypD [Kiritimatiellia bacterium]
MRYVDEYRDGAIVEPLGWEIRRLAVGLARKCPTTRIMEVCGTHTMAIARYGIRQMLPENIRLVSGPGCPVCVTVPGYIDAAILLASQGLIIATFGDLLTVPGSSATLAQCRAEGGNVQVCYSPADALRLAQQHPQREVVFLAIGFETTIAPVMAMLEQAIRSSVKNLSLLTAFKLVPPALEALLADPSLGIHGLLCPGHVSAIIGAAAYEQFAGPNGVPCVIAGFEPLDILLGLVEILRQLCADEARVVNQYSRVVRPAGNLRAQALIRRYLEPRDAEWRGLGRLPWSSLGLRSQYAAFNAEARYGIEISRGIEHPRCACGEVIKGKAVPWDCPLFGHACTPQHPVGPCMVSSEGSCAAYYRYVPAGRGTRPN